MSEARELTREGLRAVLADLAGDAFAVAYFDRSDFSAGPPPRLQPWSWYAEKRLRERCSRVLNQRGVRLIWSDAHCRAQGAQPAKHDSDHRW